MSGADFTVFPPETLRFLEDLGVNNDRAWFEAHRAEYERAFRRPAAAFASALAAAVSARRNAPHRARIFRIHRDIRFSKDKTPYKTHLHIAILAQESGDDAPGWFFGVEPGALTLGAGAFAFDKAALERFRARVMSDEGAALAGLLARAGEAGLRVSEPALKRPPRGLDPAHPRADLLRHKGLALWRDEPDPRRIEQPGLVAHCVDAFALFAPVMDWLGAA